MKDASQKFGLIGKFEFSVGFTIRDDMDFNGSAKDCFEHWVEKYAMVKKTLAPYEKVDNAKYFRRNGISFYNERPIGDGYTCVGDSVAFSNPFLSRGLNVGAIAVASAARAIADGFDKDVQGSLSCSHTRTTTNLFNKSCVQQ